VNDELLLESGATLEDGTLELNLDSYAEVNPSSDLTFASSATSGITLALWLYPTASMDDGSHFLITKALTFTNSADYVTTYFF